VRAGSLGATLVAALALSACSAAGSTPPTTTVPPAPSSPPTTSSTPSTAAPRTSTPRASDSATPVASSASPTPAVALTDYGATLEVWATRHHEDERFDPGAMWDPTPGWGPDDAHDDKVDNLLTTGGRVLRYDLSVPRPSVPAAQAISLAESLLPSDAVVLWRKQYAACYVVQLTSASLGAVLARAPYSNPDGHVELELRSGTPPTPTTAFDPTAVTTVLVRPVVAATPSNFAGC
jgi:hypothetical protein